MRILFVTQHAMNWYGGGEKVLETFCDFLIDKGNDVYILNFCQDCEENKESRVEPYKKYYKTLFVENIKLPRKYSMLFYLIKYIFSNRTEYGTTIVSKIIEEIGDIDLIIVTPVFLLGGIKKAISNTNSRAKIAFWDHGSIPEIFASNGLRSNIRKIMIGKLVTNWIRHADSFLAISEGIGRIIKSKVPNMDVRIIYNPIGQDATVYIKEPARPIFVFVGRIEECTKNIKFLFKALGKIKDEQWCLKIYGIGPDMDILKANAVKKGIEERLEWKGFVEQPFDSLSEATCLLLTSKTEGFPLVLVEAIERGLPVIAANCPTGPAEIVLPGQNGFLYEPGNLNQLVDMLRLFVKKKTYLPDKQKIANTVKKYNKEIVLERAYKQFNLIIKKDNNQRK